VLKSNAVDSNEPYIAGSMRRKGLKLKIAKEIFDVFVDAMKPREKEGLVFSAVRNFLQRQKPQFRAMTVEEKMRMIEEYRAKKEAEEYREPMTLEEYYEMLEEYEKQHPSPGPEKPALF